MRYLVFQLYAPISSWGEPATGEIRRSASHPTRSAILGLVGAALGLRRDSEAELAQLRDGLAVAIKQITPGTLLQDYHTTQAPGQGRGARWASRKEELAGPRHRLHTILSMRDYRCDGMWKVAVRALAGCPWTLEELANALRRPRFVLYLGRKSCPLGAPLAPAVMEADGIAEALAEPFGKLTVLAPEEERTRLGMDARAEYFWEGDAGDLEPQETRWVQDEPVHRGRWQFRGRHERWSYGEGE